MWECKYHLVWIPKCRKKIIYGELRKYLGEIFRELAKQKECNVIEGHLMSDHVHMLLSIPPKYAVSQVAGFIKGKSAIQIARGYQGRIAALTRGTKLQCRRRMQARAIGSSALFRRKATGQMSIGIEN